MNLEELSSRMGASVRGLRALLNALFGLEFLVRNDDGRYALTPESATFLVRNKPAYRGDFFTFVPGMIQRWLNLRDSVKSGEPVVAVNSEREGVEFFREFVKSLFSINFAPANTLAAALKAKREVTSVLDVAAGSGVWGIVLAEQFPPRQGHCS
jgi:methyltransferase family protein